MFPFLVAKIALNVSVWGIFYWVGRQSAQREEICFLSNLQRFLPVNEVVIKRIQYLCGDGRDC